MNDKVTFETTTEIVETTKAQGDEPMSNHSDNPHFSTLLEKRLSRRSMLSGSITAAMAGMFVATVGLPNVAEARTTSSIQSRFGRNVLNPTLGFEAIPPTRSDTTASAMR